MSVTLPADLLIQSLSTGTYVVTRRRAPAYVDGVVTPDPNPVTLSILASVVPASGRDLLRLPEGQRSTETRTVYTVTQLMVAAAGAKYANDVVSIDGDQWQVQQVQSFPGAPGFFQALVQRAGAVQP